MVVFPGLKRLRVFGDACGYGRSWRSCAYSARQLCVVHRCGSPTRDLLSGMVGPGSGRDGSAAWLEEPSLIPMMVSTDAATIGQPAYSAATGSRTIARAAMCEVARDRSQARGLMRDGADLGERN